jgi:hypothetical protein
MPDPQKVLATLRRAAILSRATRGRQGSVVHLDGDAEEVLVVGDLHGSLGTLRQVLEFADLARHPRRHLVLQELVHGPYFYPEERGDRSHQMVDVAAALKCQFPDRLHLVLGNHELSELTERSIAKNGVYLNELFRQGVETAYGAAAPEVIRAYRDFFAAMPLGVRTPNRVFICHTIPDGRDLDRLDPEVLRTGHWPPEALKRGGTVYALTWGRDTAPETADLFAAWVDADLFICGHQPCDEGFRRANHRQLIIDGTDPYPACCLFRAQAPATLDTLVEGVRLLTTRMT